ncbi:hypothetical protein [Roseivivax lentus]|uniref:hypothetical protein n=1 Tax=Roseivivax lentus TaxID=633194 RepID=UPI00117ABE31|nr:hypothetical protein [Roseivivax lentus]
MSALVLASAGAGYAQEKYFLHVTLKDESYSLTSPPTVHYEVYPFSPSTAPGMPEEDSIVPTKRGEPSTFIYGEDRLNDYIGGQERSNYFVFIDVDRPSNLLPADPGKLLVRMNPRYLGGQPIQREIVLKTRAQFAELYRIEVNQILRLSRLSDSDFERAYKAALGAIDYNPELDNFLLFVKVLRAQLAAGAGPPSYAPATPEELAIQLSGYSDLPFRERWLVELDLLDTLVGASDLDRAYGSAGTVRDAALLLGTAMIDALDGAEADLADLPVVRVYQHLSALHAEAGDCVSLSENAARALADAEAIRMAWTAQRRLFLDWGTCLETMSGFGTGPTIDAIIEDASEKPFLRAQWGDFADASLRAESRLEFATAAADVRIRDLKDISLRISERTPE